MPIGRKEVLDVLKDPLVDKMCFSIGALRVTPAGFRIVARYIEADDIHVVPGSSGRLAIYDRKLNRIETPTINPPLSDEDRAQLLHECVHAISDLNGCNSALDDEVAGYLAQILYGQLKRPTKPILASDAMLRAASPKGRMVYAMQQTVRNYQLDNPRGFGASLNSVDIYNLREVVRGMPDYAGLTQTSQNSHPGVPVVNGDQMQALREALQNARRPSRKPATPIARPMIF